MVPSPRRPPHSICTLRHRATAHDPAHGRITAKPVGIVHVLVPGQSPEHGRPALGRQAVAAVLAGPGIGETLSGQVCQAERIIEISKREQTSIGCHSRPMEFQLQAGIERDSENGTAFVTRYTVHLQPRGCHRLP